MIDKDAIQKFNSLKKLNPSEKDLNNIMNAISSFAPIVYFIANRTNIHDIDELKENVMFFSQNIYDKYSDKGYIDSLLYEYQAMCYILKNPKLISTEYLKVKDNKPKSIIHNASLNRSINLCLSKAVADLSNINEFKDILGITKHTKINQIPMFKLNSEQKFGVKLAFEVSQKNRIEDQLLLILKQQKEGSEKHLKETLISYITSSYNFFNDFKFLDDYLNSYSSNSKKFGFSTLQFEKTTGSYSKDTIGIDELFSKQFLETLDINELCFLNAFWSNRFAKECANFSLGACAIDSLDLWQTIIDKKPLPPISDDALTAIYRKNSFITTLLDKSFSQAQENLISRELKECSEPSLKIETDYSYYYNQLDNFLGKDYTKFFSEDLPGNNNFLENLTLSSLLVNLENFMYQEKKTTLEPLIKLALTNHNIKNWGLIREEISNGNKYDSIDSKNSRLLIAFDVEKFNFPFRFHIDANSLMDLAKIANGNTLIREYTGDKDFTCNGEIIPSNIIMPIPKRHKQIIMDNAKNSTKNKNFWEHLYFLMNGKLPEHFTKEIQKNNKKAITTSLPVYYTDLKTGKRFCKIDNKLIPVELEDSNVR